MKKNKPVWLLCLIDLAALGAALVVFALFHHVIPTQKLALNLFPSKAQPMLTPLRKRKRPTLSRLLIRLRQLRYPRKPFSRLSQRLTVYQSRPAFNQPGSLYR